MAALTANREDKYDRLAGIGIVATLAVLASEILYSGGILAVDENDEVQMASATQGLRVIGTCAKKVDNTDDGKTIDRVLRGIMPFNISSSYPLARSGLGLPVFVEDDQTVGSYNATALVPAGILHDLESGIAWVDQRPEALALARLLTPATVVAKTDDYTCTAAIAFDGRTAFKMTKTGGLTLTLPGAVAGMRVGVIRGSATAADDVTVQAATGDKIQGSDAISAASKAIENTVDAVSGILWLRAADDTHWLIDNPLPADVGSWVKNDA